MTVLDINFEGFWQCRLATDPDPSDEQRGISGFTFSVAGESLLEPSMWSQASDIKTEYGMKAPEFQDGDGVNGQLGITNIREASPDFSCYNQKGIGIYVKEVKVNGILSPSLTAKFEGFEVRFKSNPYIKDYPWKGPIFEGRNQIVSDGDPDRFTLNPFVLNIKDPVKDSTVLERFDPLDIDNPYDQLYQLFPNDPLVRRLPVQRFAMSDELLSQIGLTEDTLPNHFTNRAAWLQTKVTEARNSGKEALAQAYASRLYAVEYFTKATGPTVLENRLLSRVSLRQLYHHTIRGTESMNPVPEVDQAYFENLTIDKSKEWDMLYYLGGYDGDLMAGWCTGTLSLPLVQTA